MSDPNRPPSADPADPAGAVDSAGAAGSAGVVGSAGSAGSAGVVGSAGSAGSAPEDEVDMTAAGAVDSAVAGPGVAGSADLVGPRDAADSGGPVDSAESAGPRGGVRGGVRGAGRFFGPTRSALRGGAAVAPGPRTAEGPGRVLRGCALAVLLLAALTVAGSALPGWRTTDDLAADLAAGRVSYLEYQPASDTVRWVDGWVSWRQALLAAAPVEVPGQPVLGREEDWVRGRIDASGHPVDLVVRQGSGVGWDLWVLSVPSKPLRGAAIVVWLLALVHMLTRGGHRVANRWAWFWLFTIGQGGALLYLLREPVPLWRRKLNAAEVSAPTRGGVGFAQAVLLAFGTGVLALGVAALLR